MPNTLTAGTQYANIDNKKIGYRKFGNGTPIILANRFRGTIDTWDPLFPDLLAETNTVIAFDYSWLFSRGFVFGFKRSSRRSSKNC